MTDKKYDGSFRGDDDLAREHVEWYMSRLREQLLAWCDITEQLLIDNFRHGIKHGRELEREERRELPKDM